MPRSWRCSRSRHSPTRSTACSRSGSAGTSELGKHLDPLADKLLLVTVFVCLSLNDKVPWLLTALVLLRDLVIVFGAITFRALFGPVRGNPTGPSKANTLAQIVFCLAVVASAGVPLAGGLGA